MALFTVTTELLLGTKTNTATDPRGEDVTHWAGTFTGGVAGETAENVEAFGPVTDVGQIDTFIRYLVTTASTATAVGYTMTTAVSDSFPLGTPFNAGLYVRSNQSIPATATPYVSQQVAGSDGANINGAPVGVELAADEWHWIPISGVTSVADVERLNSVGLFGLGASNVNEAYYVTGVLAELGPDVVQGGLFFEGTMPAWTDISADVLQRDPIQITRGRADEASTADPSSCTLTLNNRLGKYSPRNPMSPYYGRIGRNTQIRILADGVSRFYGEVSVWPQRWDKSGTDVWTPVQAYGVTRRLGQGTATLGSVMYRLLTSADSVVAYWPCEDGEDATEFASALPGHRPMLHPSGATENASFDGFKCSEPLPLVSEVQWTGAVSTYTVTGETQVRFLLAIPAAGLAATASVCRIRSTGTTAAGLVATRWDLTAGVGGSLRLQVFNDDDVQVQDSGFQATDLNGRLVMVSIEIENVGIDINWAVNVFEVGDLTAMFSFSDTLPNRTFGRVLRLGMNVWDADGDGDMDDVALGHISVQSAITSVTTDGLALRAYEGEWAGGRIQRLCAEEGVALTTRAAVGVQETVEMGPQLPGALLDLLAEAADADMGILFESRDALGLKYTTRARMYAQDAALTLDYSAGTLSAIEPTEDDDATRNDITVKRVDGSSARAQLETGPLSVNPPPDGVGRYDTEVTVSVERDADLPNQASWRLHMGTVDEARYPVLGINLAAGAFTSDAVLTAAAQTIDVGDRLVVTNPPAHLPPEDIQQIVQGFSETLTPFEWLIDVNCAPASPYDVAVWDDTTGPGEARYSSDGTTLNEDLDATETGVNVITPTGPLWSDADAPFDIVIGGERMTVTDVTGALSAQVFTVTRSVNQVVKAHDSGAAVALAKPGVYAL